MPSYLDSLRGSFLNQTGWVSTLMLIFLAPIAVHAASFENERSGNNTRVANLTEEGSFAPNGKGPFETLWLPPGDLFEPLLADPKQERFFLSYRHVRFRGDGLPAEGLGKTINAGVVGLGASFGLWGLRKPENNDGLQVDFLGAVFSQFNLDTSSDDLINSDFLVGLPITLRQGPFSARIRFFHQSSHLGDEFLLNNPTVQRANVSFEEIDSLFSFERHGLRLYGGGGYIFEGSDFKLDPLKAQWGVEWKGPIRPTPRLEQVQVKPVFGADFKSFEEQGWNITVSLAGGLEWLREDSNGIRILLVYLRGFMPFGQFFLTEKMENFGVEIQFPL
jgi:hypothetical protein